MALNNYFYTLSNSTLRTKSLVQRTKSPLKRVKGDLGSPTESCSTLSTLFYVYTLGLILRL